MLDIYYKTTKNNSFEKIKSIRDGVWININNAQKEDLERITKLTDLDYADRFLNLDEKTFQYLD